VPLYKLDGSEARDGDEVTARRRRGEVRTAEVRSGVL